MVDSRRGRLDLLLARPDTVPLHASTSYRAGELFLDDSIPVLARVTRLTDSDAYPPHTHEDFVEIVVVAEGEGRHVAAHGWTALTPGRVVVIRQGAWHAFYQTGDVVAAAICISTKVLNSDLGFLRTRTSTRDLLFSGPVGPSAKGVWTTEVDRDVVDDVVAKTRALERLIATRASDTLVLLGEAISLLGRLTKGLPGDSERLSLHPGVIATIESLENAPEHEWTMDELASLARLSKGHLSRLFHDAVGLPPIAYLAQLRAERSAGLLSSTDLSVKAIGASVGWPDPAFFYRRFRALVGMSPRDYRGQMRGGSSEAYR